MVVFGHMFTMTQVYIILFVFLVLCFALFVKWLGGWKRRRLKKRIRKGTFIPAEEFLEDWILEKEGNQCTAGYKAEVFSGCYVITIHEKPVKNGNYMHYDDIYIGQSLNVTNRVHSHLTGKGNGDVFADLKYGYSVYVELLKCPKQDMNDLERELIDLFHATDSYNATAGGATDRHRRGLFKR